MTQQQSSVKRIALYPPGGGDPVYPHPSKVEQMIGNGWTETKPKPKKSEVEDNG